VDYSTSGPGWPDGFVNKIAQIAVPSIYSKFKKIHNVSDTKVVQKHWANSVIFKKLPKVNIRQRGENSPNLVALIRAYPSGDHGFDFFIRSYGTRRPSSS
jgi:hypothetical protein